MSAGGAAFGEWHSPAPPTTQPQGGNVVTKDWVREVVTDHAFRMQSELDKIASKLERDLGGATSKMQQQTDDLNRKMKDLLENVGTLARAMSEEQRRGAERDHDIESIMGLNLGNQRQPAALAGPHAAQGELDKLKEEIADLRKLLPASIVRMPSVNPANNFNLDIHNLQLTTVDTETQVKKCIAKLADVDKRFGRMEKKHTLSIISLSVFCLKAAAFGRDARDKLIETLGKEQQELREVLQTEEDLEGSEDDISNDRDSNSDPLEVEADIDEALESCEDSRKKLDDAYNKQDEELIARLTHKLHDAQEKLGKAKRKAHKCGYHEKDEEIERMWLELVSYDE